MRFNQAFETISNDGNVGVYVPSDVSIVPETYVLLGDRRVHAVHLAFHVFYTDGICINTFKKHWHDSQTACEAFINEMESND